MPATDDLLRDLWRAVERAGAVEQELRTTADELAAWREVAQAAVRALDREIARRQEEEAARTIA
jgi:hypothetical protein